MKPIIALLISLLCLSGMAQNQYFGTFSGNGAALTALSGGNITPGTVSSNALDAPTKAQLFAGGGGTVASVTLAPDAGNVLFASVSGSPITTSGTLTPVLQQVLNNLFLAGPPTAPFSTPTYRAIVAADFTSTLKPIFDGGGLTNLTSSNLIGVIPSALIATNYVNHVAGSASVASIGPSNTTGFNFASGVNTAYNGTNILTVVSGKVGIGTTNPSVILHVVNNGVTGSLDNVGQFDSTNTFFGFTVNGIKSGGNSQGNIIFSKLGVAQASIGCDVAAVNKAELFLYNQLYAYTWMFCASNGNVSIGKGSSASADPVDLVGATVGSSTIKATSGFINGVTTAPTVISVGASPFTYTAGSVNEAVIIGGGTVSAITYAGTAIPAALLTLSATYPLGPAQTIVVTYTVAPSMVSHKGQ